VRLGLSRSERGRDYRSSRDLLAAIGGSGRDSLLANSSLPPRYPALPWVSPLLRRAPITGFAATLLIPATAALSQESPPKEPAPAPPEIQAIPLEEVQERAEAAFEELEGMLPGEALQRSLEEIGGKIERLEQDSALLVQISSSTISATMNVGRLQETEIQLNRLLESLKEPDAALDAHLASLRQSLDRIDALSPVWKKTEEQARRAGASDSLLRRIASTRRAIGRARQELVARRNEVLTLRTGWWTEASLESPSRRCGAIQDQLAQLTLPPPPADLERRPARSVLEELSETMRQQLGARLRRTAEYARDRALLAFQVALLLALALALRVLRDRARVSARESYDLREAQRVFELPGSMALFISLAVTPRIHPLAPPLFIHLAITLVVVPLVLIVRRLAPPSMIAFVIGLPIFYAVDQVRYIMDTAPTIMRMLFLLELLFALGLLWLHRGAGCPGSAEIPEVLRGPPSGCSGGDALRDRLLRPGDRVRGGRLATSPTCSGTGTLRSAYVAVSSSTGCSRWCRACWPTRW
jgi:hypothetical protein